MRSLARSLWGGLEKGADKLAPLIRTRELDWAELLDDDAVASSMVAMSLLAVADHARSMTALVLSPKLGPSSATVARGAFEALARIRWISLGETADEVRARALAALHDDVSRSAHATEFISASGEIGRDAYIALVNQHIRALGVQRPTWSLGIATREAAIEAWGHADLDEWMPYSQLSSSAHGMMPALGSLLLNGRLRLPRQEIVNHIGFVYGVADRTVHALGDCPLPFLEEGTVEKVWESITTKLEPLRLQLAEEDNGDVPLKPTR